MIKFLSLVACVSLLLCGCTTTWQDSAGKVLATTAQTVDSAMKGWATYVVINKVPEDKQLVVRDSYAKYQTAFETARLAYNAAVINKDQSVWAQASNALAASKSNLLILVQQFTTK